MNPADKGKLKYTSFFCYVFLNRPATMSTLAEVKKGTEWGAQFRINAIQKAKKKFYWYPHKPKSLYKIEKFFEILVNNRSHRIIDKLWYFSYNKKYAS